MEREEIYARYDGPPPRKRSLETGPGCWLFMLRNTLRAIRLRRRRGERDGLAALTRQVNVLRHRLAPPPPTPGNRETNY